MTDGTTDPPEPSGDAPAAAATERASLRSAALVGLWTLVSRITGLAREATRASFLGLGLAADAFQVAFLIPNLFRRLVGEGAISSAMVPVFSEYAVKASEEEQRVLAEKFLTLWAALALVVALVGVFGAGYLVAWAFRWGGYAEQPGKVELTAELTSLLFWYLLVVGMAAALQGILNARKIFGLPSLAPALFNLAFIACAWFVAPRFAEERERAFVLAGAVIVGGVVHFGVMLPSIWRLGIRPRMRWPFDHTAVRRILRLFLPAVFGAGVYQLNAFVSCVIAGSVPGDGAVAALGYSNRLMEFVLGVFVFALGTVSLTSLSRQGAEEDLGPFRAQLAGILRWVTLITVPSTVGLFLLRDPTIDLVLRFGSFDGVAVERTAFAFQFHIVGLAFVGFARMLVGGFYALQDVRTPVVVAALTFVVHSALAWGLSLTELSYAGIALASTVGAALQTVLLWYAIARRGVSPEGDVFRHLTRTLLAALVMGLAIAWPARWLGGVEGKLPLLAGLGGTIVFGAGVFFVAARAVGLGEVSEFWALVRRRLSGRRR